MTELKVRVVGQYKGHTLTENNIIKLNLMFPGEEAENYIAVPGMRNENIEVTYQNPPEEPLELGTFLLKNFNIGEDGDVKVLLQTPAVSVELDNLNMFAYIEKGTDIVFTLTAEIEDDELEGDWQDNEVHEKDDYEQEVWDEDDESWGDDDENNNDDW